MPGMESERQMETPDRILELLQHAGLYGQTTDEVLIAMTGYVDEREIRPMLADLSRQGKIRWIPEGTTWGNTRSRWFAVRQPETSDTAEGLFAIARAIHHLAEVLKSQSSG